MAESIESGIQTQIERLAAAKAEIAAAIAAKGVTVPDGTLLDGMAALIASIDGGGSVTAQLTIRNATSATIGVISASGILSVVRGAAPTLTCAVGDMVAVTGTSLALGSTTATTSSNVTLIYGLTSGTTKTQFFTVDAPVAIAHITTS